MSLHIDGRNFSGPRHGLLCCHQVDTTHGFLYHLLGTDVENMARLVDLSGQVGSQTETHRQTIVTMVVSHFVGHGHLLEHLDHLIGTKWYIHHRLARFEIQNMRIQLVGPFVVDRRATLPNMGNSGKCLKLYLYYHHDD